MVALGNDAAANRAEGLFAALGARVTSPTRNVKYDSARIKIANDAFLPGRIFKDTSIWTGSPMPSRKQLLVRGRFENGAYRLDAEPVVRPPMHPAESRHVINLTRLSDDDEYAWDTDVPYAVGGVTAREIGLFFTRMYSSAESRTEKDVRDDIAATLPRASQVLGQLFTIDSIRTDHLGDGSTRAFFAVRMHTQGVEQRFPHFARYMRAYAVPTRMKFSLTGSDSATFVECVAPGNGTLTFKLRTLRGQIIALNSPLSSPIPWPDSMKLNGELAMKVRRFTVGFHDYHADLSVISTDHERGFNIVSRQEPQWTLPLITEHLIRTPLKRPFKGSGAQFRIGFRDSTGTQTLLTRRLHLEVQESLILRFINRLAGATLGDWVGKAEEQQMAWLQEVFDGIVEDVRHLSR
jgi:hypothetical protein